jgi:hypothetical protein
MGGGYDSVKTIKGKFSAARYESRMYHDPTIAPAVETEAKSYTIEDGHVLRSRILDAFSRLEKVIADKARKAGIKVTRGTPMSDYLQDLGKAEFTSPAKAIKKIEVAKRLLFVRNDIVHSELEMTECTGAMAGTFYIFQNAASEEDAYGRCVRLISANELEALPTKIKNLANELKQQNLTVEAPTAPASASAPAAPPTPQ